MVFHLLNGVIKMNDVLEDIKNQIKSKTVVVVTSGGPDSMCLLNIMQKKTNKIVVCHINHNVRKESKEEEIFLKNYTMGLFPRQ